MSDRVHTVGKRKPKAITFHATAENFIEGCLFNDALHAFPTGNRLYMPKGVYHFRTHREADEHRMHYRVKGIAAESVRGK